MIAMTIRLCLLLPGSQPPESLGGHLCPSEDSASPWPLGQRFFDMDPIELVPLDLRKPSWTCTQGLSINSSPLLVHPSL